MTTDSNRIKTITDALDYLVKRAQDLKEVIEEEQKLSMNVSETDLQIDLQATFDNFLYKIGYLYNQRRF